MINNISTLNKKVDVLSGVSSSVKGFETIDDDILYKNIWASIQPLRGREYLEMQRNRNDEFVKINVRYRENINEGCKIRYKHHIYEVVSIADVEMSHEILELRCTEKKRGSTLTGTTLKQSGEWIP